MKYKEELLWILDKDINNCKKDEEYKKEIEDCVASTTIYNLKNIVIISGLRNP